ncbi:HAD hydrolase-like protein [Pedobacter sp. P351]|uniref:HAD hydrolase-like protein n=1 Tax=Pedobacter superstes TaxID=3133441 RepID=UPI003096CDB0
MKTFANLISSKNAFIFEMDDVLFPSKDYDLQVYYLFANFLEFQEGFPVSNDLIQFMKKVHQKHGPDRIFDKAKEVYAFDEKYRANFERLLREAKLPLKLLLFQNMLSFLQEIVVDRKQIFIVTAGDPLQQLNKIKHTEWHGLEKFLRVYFADEIKPKPSIDVIRLLMEENDLKEDDFVIVGSTERDQQFALAAGIEYVPVSDFIS